MSLPQTLLAALCLSVLVACPVGEPDADGDGLSDADEATVGSDPDNPDSDGDGLSDGEEIWDHATNPLSSDGYSDADEVAGDTATQETAEQWDASYPNEQVPVIADPVLNQMLDHLGQGGFPNLLPLPRLRGAGHGAGARRPLAVGGRDRASSRAAPADPSARR